MATAASNTADAGQRRSSLYLGHTTHTRRAPAANAFTYSLFMACVDLSELESGRLDAWPVFSSRTPWCLTSLLPRDHLIPSASGAVKRLQQSAPGSQPKSLRDTIAELVHRETGTTLPHDSQIRLLTGLRVFGLEFNPVSFFYVLDRDGERVNALVAEVNNIPWFEQHVYVMTPSEGDCGRQSQNADALSEDNASKQPADGSSSQSESYAIGDRMERFDSHAKAFHVSPFMPIQDISYDWRVGRPAQRLRVSIGLREKGTPVFSAWIDMKQRRFSVLQLLALLLAYPFMTIKVVLAIMYEAAKLYLHGAFTFYSHPEGAETGASKAIEVVVQAYLSVKARISPGALKES